MRDYYEILGVTRTIDEAGLKSAFRKLAMEHHPDRNGGCENAAGRFKEINEAYSVLSDPQKRASKLTRDKLRRSLPPLDNELLSRVAHELANRMEMRLGEPLG